LGTCHPLLRLQLVKLRKGAGAKEVEVEEQEGLD
jgi:hypothetical protein